MGADRILREIEGLDPSMLGSLGVALGARELPGASDPRDVSRREFMRLSAAVGGGLVLAVSLPGCRDSGTRTGSAGGLEITDNVHGTPAPAGDAWSPGAWLRLHPDNTATLTVANSEMGQGVRTTLALLIAEEADLDWDRVRVTQAPADEATYGRQGTGGSGSVRTAWMPLRQAGAAARAVLVAAAAAELGVSAEELATEDSHVVHEAGGRRIPYADLLDRAAGMELPSEVSLKPPAEWRLLGKERMGIDVLDVVRGRAEYGIDVEFPGMRYAAIARTPVHGGRVRRFDPAAALAVPGVRQVVEVPAVGGDTNVHSGVAVIADDTWAAIRGRDALEIDWDPGEGADDSTEGYLERMRAGADGPGAVLVNRAGDPDALIDAAGAAVVRADFAVPFISHATMEPMNATAHFADGRMRVKAPTQFPNWARQATAAALGLPLEQVSVEVSLIGGGYGRRINPDYAVEAALVARQVEGPVKVQWTREDDLRHDFYRPTACHRLDAVLGEDGYPVAWRQRFCTPAISGTISERVDEDAFGVGESDGGANMMYRVPNRSCEYTYLPSHITRGWWRAVHTTHNTFAVEVFLDELAEVAGIDPVAYRVALIDEYTLDRPGTSSRFPRSAERLRGVVRRAAEAADWGHPVPDGHGMGIACAIDHLSYSAEVIEASVEDGRVVVHNAWCAVDCGPVLNPNHARAQVEGALIQGLSAALGERLTVEGGAIVEGNFDRYPVLRMRDAPRNVEVHFVETDTHPTGLGEPGLPPAAPALANALYAATRRRFRTLPIEL